MTASVDDKLPRFQAFVINLERAEDRWEKIRKNLEECGFRYVRVDAVLGDDLPEAPEGYSVLGYRILTGKETNRREIGCYFSHIEAMRQFLQTPLEYALILEDDAVLSPGLRELLTVSVSKNEGWDMLRLCSSRKGRFLCFEKIDERHCLAYNLKPLKNTAAYMINRYAAQRCIDRMLPMRQPYDVAVDREWSYGFKTACIAPFPVQLDDEVPGQIPKAKRIRLYRSTSFHFFHMLTHIQRVLVRGYYFLSIVLRRNLVR